MSKPQDLRDEIIRALNHEGFYRLRPALDSQRFDEVVGALGEVLRREDVRLHLSRRGVHQPEKLDFHTDQPYVDIIAWQCMIPDPHGPTLLLDLREIVSSFPAGKLALLEKVTFDFPHPDRRHEKSRQSLLESSGGGWKFCFMPWHVTRPMTPEVQDVWSELLEKVDAFAAAREIGVVLEEGECLFLANRLMLHGRPAISANSPRFLRRVWIESERVAGARPMPAPQAGETLLNT